MFPLLCYLKLVGGFLCDVWFLGAPGNLVICITDYFRIEFVESSDMLGVIVLQSSLTDYLLCSLLY